MPTTTAHGIYYPAGTAVPNIPVQSQTTAESVEAALNKVTKAPVIMLEKTLAQSTPADGSSADITWDREIHKQGITHATNAATVVVPENGFYTATFRGAFVSGSEMAATVILNVNGTDLPTTRTDQYLNAPGVGAKPTTSVVVKLNAGDVCKVRFSSTAPNRALVPSECFFQLTKSGGF